MTNRKDDSDKLANDASKKISVETSNKKSHESPDEKPLDRQAFFKEIRSGVLKKLGLPMDTRPENVLNLLKLQNELDKINGKKKKPS
ncbi:MAG: hypothetical protein LBR53_01825 [Deltaproteobacteria bacterium]|jgi:hypothetical protein|nr:hypothetical protein [Deltaproteobacteria bacterium]